MLKVSRKNGQDSRSCLRNVKNLVNEYYKAPVTLMITFGVHKFYCMKRKENKWTYHIKINFSFDGFDDYKIVDDIITGLGVYEFDNENHARVQAKREAKAHQERFLVELRCLIKKVAFNE